jgi:hypothetical protein
MFNRAIDNQLHVVSLKGRRCGPHGLTIDRVMVC